MFLVYAGGDLVYMSIDGEPLRFSYSADGTPMSVIYKDSVYFYVTNLQGDVVALVSSLGNTVVEYTYDAWGNILTTTGRMAQALGKANPLRYRGYVYDNETGLYYVSSRYYNPEMGRWINEDGVMSEVGEDISGYNLFAYCMNNPVNMSDPTGNWPKFIKEIGARLTHAVKTMTRIITSPLKAITFEIGGGVGYGASAKVTAAGVSAEVSAYATTKDTYVYDKGTHDVRNTTSAKIGLQIGPIDGSSSNGIRHSYFDERCNCSVWDNTFGEKVACNANERFVETEATLGISAGLYVAIGFEVSLSFDFKAWGEELISIYHESFSFKGYYG